MKVEYIDWLNKVAYADSTATIMSVPRKGEIVILETGSVRASFSVEQVVWTMTIDSMDATVHLRREQ